MPDLLKTKFNSNLITLKEEIGGGGEGKVCSIKDETSCVAKIFSDQTLTKSPELEQKLISMVNQPPQDTALESFGYPSIAWPLDLLYRDSRFVGYLMPYLSNSVDIIRVYNPAHRKRDYPHFNWHALVRVARNFATIVDTLHRFDYVIGDISPKNVFVSKDKGIVTIIDTDSFQVKDQQGQVYPCKVATPLFTPPELQNTHQIRSKKHDYFGLGVMIFYLLMEGSHPFLGSLNKNDGSIAKIEEYLIQQKVFPYEPNHLAGPHPYAPPYNMLPENIRLLFRRCFVDGITDPSKRPPAQVWGKELETLETSLCQCKNNGEHFYSNHLPFCPWCNDIVIGTQTPLIKPVQSSIQPISRPRPPVQPHPIQTEFILFLSAIGLLLLICVACVIFFVWTGKTETIAISPDIATNQARVTATAHARRAATARAVANLSNNAPETTATAQAKRVATSQAVSAALINDKATATAQYEGTATVRARGTATEQARKATVATNMTLVPGQQSQTIVLLSEDASPCSQIPQGAFANLWRENKDLLGCPTDLSPIYGQFADMPFEKGHLFWIGSVDGYDEVKRFILITGGQNDKDTGTWAIYPDTWRGEVTCRPEPPSGLYAPERGFASVWCQNDGLNKLGYATAPQEFSPSYGINALQNFEKALVFRDSDGFNRGLVYVLFGQNRTYLKMKY